MTPIAAILAPLTGAFILPLVSMARRKALKAAIATTGVISFAVTILTAMAGWETPTVCLTGGWAPDLGIVLVVDSLSALFLLMGALGFGAALICSMEKLGGGPWRYYALLFLSWASVNGILCTGDLFNLYVFYEIFSVSAYLLVAFSTMAWQAIEAGFKYLVFGTVGALFFLMGTTYAFMATGILNLALLHGALAGVPLPTVTVLSGCLVMALFIKMGAFPTHFWLPDAHSSAQTAVSALLSGVLVKISIYVLIRLSSLLFLRIEPQVFPIILSVGSLSLLTGHLMASRQDDIKRLLAYSTVAHIGYILIGVGCASAAGFSAAVYHAFNHMAAKMGLFLTAGLLADDAKTRKISEMAGTGRHRPLTTLAFAFFAAALVGAPPLNGFMSKWFLTLASVEEHHFLPALLLIAGTLISAGYYLKILCSLLSPGKEPGERKSRSFTRATVAALLILCLILTALPFSPDLWDGLTSMGASVMDSSTYLEAVTGP